MATVKPVGAKQIDDGSVVGTFDFARDDQPTVRFSLSFKPNANQVEIGQALAAKCVAIASQEPSPALSILEQMVQGGQSFKLPDNPPAA